jgi:hypothetical protein
MCDFNLNLSFQALRLAFAGAALYRVLLRMIMRVKIRITVMYTLVIPISVLVLDPRFIYYYCQSQPCAWAWGVEYWRELFHYVRLLGLQVSSWGPLSRAGFRSLSGTWSHHFVNVIVPNGWFNSFSGSDISTQLWIPSFMVRIRIRTCTCLGWEDFSISMELFDFRYFLVLAYFNRDFRDAFKETIQCVFLFPRKNNTQAYV